MQRTFFITLMAIALLTACNSNGPAAVVAADSVTNLNAFVTELPDKPGYASFKRNCMSCHSARYIQMQPNLPEKSWAAIVTKMQKSFGAPLADSSAAEIVQYLVSIKGK